MWGSGRCGGGEVERVGWMIVVPGGGVRAGWKGVECLLPCALLLFYCVCSLAAHATSFSPLVLTVMFFAILWISCWHVYGRLRHRPSIFATHCSHRWESLCNVQPWTLRDISPRRAYSILVLMD